jgi:peroxiredoxin
MLQLKVKVNGKAPDFELVDTHDQVVRLSQYRGKSWVYLVLNRGFV